MRGMATSLVTRTLPSARVQIDLAVDPMPPYWPHVHEYIKPGRQAARLPDRTGSAAPVSTG